MGSVRKRIKCLHTRTKESVSFNNVICLTWVCVYHILSPNILKPPPKKRQIYPPKTLSKMERKPKHLTYLASLAYVP